MARLEGWEARLFDVMEAARHKSYVVGEHDCFRFVCQSIEALTGIDRWSEFSGYKTEREYLERMSKFGSTAEAAADWFFGAPSVDVRLARRGDACYALLEDGKVPLGICIGAEVAMLDYHGLIYVPLLSCKRAWRIG